MKCIFGMFMLIGLLPTILWAETTSYKSRGVLVTKNVSQNDKSYKPDMVIYVDKMPFVKKRKKSKKPYVVKVKLNKKKR